MQEPYTTPFNVRGMGTSWNLAASPTKQTKARSTKWSRAVILRDFNMDALGGPATLQCFTNKGVDWLGNLPLIYSQPIGLSVSQTRVLKGRETSHSDIFSQQIHLPTQRSGPGVLLLPHLAGFGAVNHQGGLREQDVYVFSLILPLHLLDHDQISQIQTLQELLTVVWNSMASLHQEPIKQMTLLIDTWHVFMR